VARSSIRATLTLLLLGIFLQACGSESDPPTQHHGGFGRGGSGGAGDVGSTSNDSGTAGVAGAGQGGAGGGNPVDSACASFAAEACDRLAQCAPFYLAVGWGSVESCQRLLSESCSHFEAEGSPLEQTSCLQAIYGPGCAGIASAFGLPEVCVHPPGATQGGDPCAWNFDCESLGCSKQTACGACVSRGGEGATCQADEECPLTQVCHAGMCSARLDANAVCDGMDDRRCPLGTSCQGGRCAPRGAENEACSDQAPCNGAQGFYCVQSKCARVEFAAENEACDLNIPTVCPGGLFCSAASTCIQAAELNQPCGNGVGCRRPFFCAEGVCVYDTPNSCG